MRRARVCARSTTWSKRAARRTDWAFAAICRLARQIGQSVVAVPNRPWKKQFCGCVVARLNQSQASERNNNSIGCALGLDCCAAAGCLWVFHRPKARDNYILRCHKNGTFFASNGGVERCGGLATEESFRCATTACTTFGRVLQRSATSSRHVTSVPAREDSPRRRMLPPRSVFFLERSSRSRNRRHVRRPASSGGA